MNDPVNNPTNDEVSSVDARPNSQQNDEASLIVRWIVDPFATRVE